MARKPTGNPDGRPKTEINWMHFEDLCGLQCTIEEIVGFFRVSKCTIQRHVKEKYGETFDTVYERFSSTGKCSLRRNQFALSKKNAAMAIHLGKTYLGQKDVVVNENHTIISQTAILEAPDNGRRKKYDPANDDDEEEEV